MGEKDRERERARLVITATFKNSLPPPPLLGLTPGWNGQGRRTRRRNKVTARKGPFPNKDGRNDERRKEGIGVEEREGWITHISCISTASVHPIIFPILRPQLLHEATKQAQIAVFPWVFLLNKLILLMFQLSKIVICRDKAQKPYSHFISLFHY